MTVPLWILGILAAPTLIVVLWLGGVFVREFAARTKGTGGEVVDSGAEAAEQLGFLPAERQNTTSAGPLPDGWETVLDAVRGGGDGGWKAAAGLLRAIGRDWERRSLATYLLADIAAEDDAWLLAWESDGPAGPDGRDDSDAALVRARSTVILAWNVRGAKPAGDTTGEQFAGFHRLLQRSREETARAAALNPDDPTPYVTEIWTALGLGYPHSEMDKLWSRLTARDPHHYEAHFAALQYWCAKWRGSRQLATQFAERAAASAPLGSLLTALPLIAHFEHDDSDDSADSAADRSPEMIAHVNAALADAAAADPTHPRLPELRHLLAYYLSLQDRDEAAVEQFRLVDGYVDALPWRYHGAGMTGRYFRIRNLSAQAVVSAGAVAEAGVV
ncbi:hypothetical protein AB0945_12200 [Streptomyces sp. NPDC005474]|uniref:hypothetical protein n=1 Tax=Streptomyces sp. NPDC005474 TaxID=3154878 RepID=UPI0034546FBE